MSLSVPPGEIALAPGASRDVPITVTRLNGSAGPLTFTATGLPAGVTAAFTGTTLRLTAAVNAPRTPLDVPRDITITATPGNGDVAPAPRTVKLPARVLRPFLLTGPDTVAVPACGGLDVALKLERDRSYTRHDQARGQAAADRCDGDLRARAGHPGGRTGERRRPDAAHRGR